MARIRTVFTGVPGTPGYSNIYVRDDGTAAGVYQTAVLNFWNSISGAFRAGLTWTMVNPIAIINDVDGSVVTTVNGDGGTGSSTGTGEPLPPATNGLVQVHTGVYVANRELRGRIFIPYPHELDQTTGVPSPEYISAIQDGLDDLNGGSGFNGAWCVWSRTHGVSNLVTSHAVWNQWAVLRSRRD